MLERRERRGHENTKVGPRPRELHAERVELARGTDRDERGRPALRPHDFLVRKSQIGGVGDLLDDFIGFDEARIVFDEQASGPRRAAKTV